MKRKEIMSDRKQDEVMRRIDKRRSVLRTQVESLAKGYTTALFVYGPGGLGKTHHITETLDHVCGRGWVHHTAITTAKGLMLNLVERPDSLHLFEDCEKMYKNPDCCSILRAACGEVKGRERWVTYTTAHESLKVRLTSGIIIVSNENISRSRGPLAAVASRFRPVKWDLTIEERMALILEIAKAGWSKNEWTLTKTECKTVATFLIEEMTSGAVDTPVDLRLFCEHALPAYAQWREDKTRTHWQDIVRSKMTGLIAQGPEKRADRNARMEQLALSIDKLMNPIKQKIELWKEKTGLGQAIYYRHLKNAKAGL